MQKKVLITILTTLTLTVIVGGFWYIKNQQKENVAIKEKQEQGQKMNSEKGKQEQGQKQEENNNQQNIEELKVEDINTSNWKEYCNKEYGFCVRYPKGWEVNDFITACVGLNDCAISCKKTPEKCKIKGVSFYQSATKNIKNANLAVSITFVTEKPEDHTKNITDKKNSKWLEGMFNGCYITSIKHFNSIDFLFASFVSVSLSNENNSMKMKNLCKSNNLNPYFNEIVKSFTSIKQ